MTFASNLADTIRAGLAPHGLMLRGAVRPQTDIDIDGKTARTVLLVGYAGGSMWPQFSAWRDKQVDRGGEHPLDGFSKAVIAPVAAKAGGLALFPSDKPWQPFQQWAMAAEGLKASPLGILIHPVYGLWHGYRGAIALVDDIPVSEPDNHRHPCDDCAEKPCLTTCPVDAVTADRFDVAACRSHLATSAGETGCMAGGCIARNACPIGAGYRYPDAQLAFHMAALSR